MKALHIPRAELYEQIWAEPMSTVAQRLGISDVGLAKACARAGIPTPPRGYWAKRQAGKPAKRPALRSARDGETDVVTLVPAPPRPKRTTTPPAIEFQDISAAVKREETAKPITADTSLKAPHPIIERAIREHRDYRSLAYGDSPYAREKAAGEPLIKRRWAILSGLFKALDQRRIQIGEPQTRNDSTGYALVVAGETVELRFRERVRQARRELTKHERALSWNRNRTWTQERFPTGELILSVSRYDPAPWEQWSDQPDLRLEEQFQEVLIGIYRAAAVERTRRLEREASARRYKEEQHNRWMAEERKKLEGLRAGTLIQHAQDWHSAAAVRSFIAAVQRAGRDGDLPGGVTDLTGWVSWASGVAHALDPLASGKVAETIDPPTVDVSRSPFHRDDRF